MIIGVIISYFLLGAIGSLLFRKYDALTNVWGNCCALAGSVFGVYVAAQVLAGHEFSPIHVATQFPFLSVDVGIDKLSALFVFVICLIAAASSIYALGYVRHYYGSYNLGTLGFFYNIFIASMILVVTATNALFFLIVWELMSLASYFLVIYERRKPENVSAGTLYFVMTHVGTACIVMLFLLAYRATGSFDFGVIRETLTLSSPLTQAAIFVLAFIGFGTKAGIIPLHIWLPAAHPAAPSHVSALMSGVMIKTGIYMLVRILVGFLGGGPLWWGVAVIASGAVSAVLGVTYALAEHDIKKLLAYHSIENIGIILLGLGSSLIFVSLRMPELAILGLVAALYHTMNHAVFKGLLFMGAGAVISETHTRNMEEYGGLQRRMSQTAVLFLIGAMAISALPPLNGFFSEWFTFQVMFQGVATASPVIKMVFALAIGALGFTGGLAAACFVKAFGVTFLARPRSEEAQHAKEVALPMRVGMTVLAACIVLFALFVQTIFSVLSDISSEIISFIGTSTSSMTWFEPVRVNNEFAEISSVSLMVGLSIILFVLYVVVRYGLPKTLVTRGRTWDCGTDLTSRMEMTATSFSRSILLVLGRVAGVTRREVYAEYVYEPMRAIIVKVSDQIKRIQSGNINGYILYIFATLVILLIMISFV